MIMSGRDERGSSPNRELIFAPWSESMQIHPVLPQDRVYDNRKESKATAVTMVSWQAALGT